MPRALTVGFAAALASSSLRPAFFVEAYFATGPLFVWSGVGPISWNGQTWLGVGTLGSISTIEEGTNVQARGISLSFGGFDATLLGDVLSEFQTGAPVTVWLGLFDQVGALIPDPVISFSGRMDQPTVRSDGATATITIACENRLIEMNVAVDRRYTDQDQRLDYPNDRGFEAVNAIQDVEIYWGHTPSGNNG